ncbi:Myxococcus xanthus paralogous family TIGR02268 [Stigmatella aurantiaca]|uniref:Myxococcus xanthus paralogous family TIGR02268 n=2 Tax=Stigmatella aurantiaca TaxID=41 RepID=A0A1H7RZP6_STIAU|nr:Myxococcus xanthus paralogous family TIGR02268 [Stigmatella aurantiaca]
MGLPAAAQAAPVEGPAPRSIVLTGKADESPLLYLAPGTFTFIILDAPILRESVAVEDRARFARVDPSDQGITLAPGEPLGPTERLTLRFTYREGSPSSAVLLLTGRAGEVDTVVNVSRPPQTVEACRVELSVTREHCEAQSQELEALRARSLTVSPAAVALAELVDKEGMKAENFEESCLKARGELRPTQCRTLGASTWTEPAPV